MSSEQTKQDLSSSYFKDLLPYAETKHVTEEFVGQVTKKLIDFLEQSNDRSNKVCEFHPPEELKKKLDLSLHDKPESLDTLLSHVDSILKYAVKTGHPRYFNQLWAGVDLSALMGEWITATTNTNMFTYEIAPVYIVMEQTVLEKMRQIVGFENGDGLMYPGGSISNIQAMALARYKFCPDFKEKGIFGTKPLISFTSEEAHYSLTKAGALLGLGMDNVVKVSTDAKGKMMPSDLRKKIKEHLAKGNQPFFVTATAATTVGGAYDPFHEISAICKEYNLWMHIDSCWGGGCLMSPKHKHLMDGCHKADSIAWNPHKLMNCLLQCSVLLVKENGLLEACNSTRASYLFQKDKKLYDVAWDTGDKTFQCGRHNDILKVWLMWKAKGSNGIAEQVDIAFSNSLYLSEQVKKRDNFELLREPEGTNVCFQYIPPRIAAMPDSPEKFEQLYKVPPEIKKRITLDGTLYVGYQPLKEHGNFFRMINVAPHVTHKDMDFVLDEIERCGKDL